MTKDQQEQFDRMKAMLGEIVEPYAEQMQREIDAAFQRGDRMAVHRIHTDANQTIRAMQVPLVEFMSLLPPEPIVIPKDS